MRPSSRWTPPPSRGDASVALRVGIPASSLSDRELLDQHRTCHALHFRSRCPATSHHGLELRGIEVLHWEAVAEMVARGHRHDAPLNPSGSPDHPRGALTGTEVVVAVGHPQVLPLARCPACCSPASVLLQPGRFPHCAHCGVALAPK